MRIGTASAVLLAAVAVGVVLLVSDGDPPEARTAKPAPPAQPARGPKNPPVVVLVLDEFPPDVLLGGDGSIDASRYPNFARLAREGYWFPNASTVYDSTTKAVPTILTGRLPQKGLKATYSDHPHSIYTMLGRRRYRIRDSEEATALCPPSLCSNAHSAKGILKRLASGRKARLEDWIGSIRASRRRLYVKHALLPHVPWIYLPSGKQHRYRASDPVPGLASVPGFGEPFLTKVNMLRHLLQVGFVDWELGRLIRRMEKVGIWDDALVVVTADHGYAFQVGVPSRRLTNGTNVQGIAPVPLFIKAPGQRRGRTLPSYVRTVDIVPTIADLLNISPGYNVDGRSAFSRATRRRRHVRVILRDFSGSVSLRARTIERKRGAFVRYKLRLFGTGPAGGPDWRLYQGIGPHKELLGRPLSELATSSRSDARAGIATAPELASVELASALRPNHIAGTIDGRTGERRAIAVAVNGRIEAVGRSFYLKGSARETFSVLVPEWVLREGRNDVRVLEVGGSRGDLRLAFLN